MAVFDFVTNPPDNLIEQAIDIHKSYFTLDTVSIPDLREWLSFNGHMDTYALHDGKVHGFFNLIPLTDACGEKFLRQEIKEENLSIQDFLPHKELSRARYTYFAAIAVKEYPRYISRQCVAAMFSVMASLLLHHYHPARLEKVFANSTTFHGHRIIQHFGMKPVQEGYKFLTENNIYMSDMHNKSVRRKCLGLLERYRPYVGINPWAEMS
jgi:hypothetical protein